MITAGNVMLVASPQSNIRDFLPTSDFQEPPRYGLAPPSVQLRPFCGFRERERSSGGEPREHEGIPWASGLKPVPAASVTKFYFKPKINLLITKLIAQCKYNFVIHNNTKCPINITSPATLNTQYSIHQLCTFK